MMEKKRKRGTKIKTPQVCVCTVDTNLITLCYIVRLGAQAPESDYLDSIPVLLSSCAVWGQVA